MMAQIVAEMEQRRGITLDSTPRVRVFSFETWRLLSCWRMFHAEETEQLSPDWVLAQLLGYLEPEWTPAMWEHLIWPAVAGGGLWPRGGCRTEWASCGLECAERRDPRGQPCESGLDRRGCGAAHRRRVD